jgi:phosphocarrier protein
LDSKTITLTISNTRGLHARASAKFVKCAEQFDAEVSVNCKGQSVPGTSIMGLMMLGACPGTKIDVTACGQQRDEALEALARLVDDKFEEE